MIRDSTRRRFAHGLLIGAIALASGCTSALESDDCVLHNRVIDETTPRDEDASRTFRYSELSERGKDVFTTVVRSDTGAYSFEHDGSNAPEEFEYTDQISTYLVVYDGSRYAFETRTNAGCAVK